MPRDVAHARECPPVPKCTRLVPAKLANFVGAGNNICPFAGLFSKPSDGLEPSTPSLPLRFRGVTRVHARSLATQFLLQIVLLQAMEMRRATSRVSFLMCPFCVRASLLAWATPTSHALSRAYGLRRLPLRWRPTQRRPRSRRAGPSSPRAQACSSSTRRARAPRAAAPPVRAFRVPRIAPDDKPEPVTRGGSSS